MHRGIRTAGLLAGAVALTLFAVRDAHGGNYSNANVKYYSVKLFFGDYLSSSDGRIILVDDVTYAIDYRPCEPGSACDYFTNGDVQSGSGGNPGPVAPGGGLLSGMQVWDTVSTGFFASSKAQFTEVILNDWDAGETTPYVVDACSFATYGQLALRSAREDKGFLFVGIHTATEPGYDEKESYAAAAGGEGLGLSQSLAMTLSSLPTSQSRHFQSPYRVRNGRVYFTVMQGSAGAISGKAIVKGRTLDASDTTAPVVDTNVTVTSP